MCVCVHKKISLSSQHAEKLKRFAIRRTLGNDIWQDYMEKGVPLGKKIKFCRFVKDHKEKKSVAGK